MVNNHSIKGIQSESKGWLLQHSSHGHCVMVKHCALHVLQILIAFTVVKILFCLHVANFTKSQATMQCLGQSGSACLRKSNLYAYTSKDWSFLLSYKIYSLHCETRWFVWNIIPILYLNCYRRNRNIISTLYSGCSPSVTIETKPGG